MYRSLDRMYKSNDNYFRLGCFSNIFGFLSKYFLRPLHCPPVRSSTLDYFLLILTVFNLSFNQSVQLVTADGCPGCCPTSCNNMARSLDLVDPQWI